MTGGRASPSLTGKQALQDERLQATFDGLRPVFACVGIVFSAFAVFNALDMPEHAVVPLVVHDVFMVLVSTLLWWGSTRWRLVSRWAAAVGSSLALLVASNILLATVLLQDSFYTNYIAVLLIGVGSLILSTRWLVFVLPTVYLAWAACVAGFTTQREFTHLSFLLVAASMISATIHWARLRSHRRLAFLRHRDERRKRELEQALAAAEVARRELDERVEERTAELVEAYDELQHELEERQRAERERRDLEAYLQQTQKLESVGRLAGGVAHDFNNLLTVVNGNIEFALAGPITDPMVREALDEASSAGRRAADVTRQLLAFSRKQVLSPQATDLGEVLQGIRKMLQRVVGEEIRLKIDTRRDVAKVFADTGQIEQVIMNLAINGCDAMHEGGTLEVWLSETTLLEADCRVNPGARKGDYVVLSIADTGHGIDENTRRLIFEPFFTTKDVGKGTGLGLAVVHGIVTQHGGFIEVRSEVGKGTVFSVYLPRFVGQVAPCTSASPVQSQWPRGSETILLAEDEVAVRRLSAMVLENLGYQVLQATDGEEALGVARNHSGAIDLLVTDVMMPQMDGPTLAERLLEVRPGLQVLFVSGYADDRLASRGVLEDGRNFLAKPYGVGVLAERVRALLDLGAMGVEEPAPSPPHQLVG